MEFKHILRGRLLFITLLFGFLMLTGFGDQQTKRVLYLVRHAKSDKSDPSLKDFDRPLAERGYKDAPLMGKVLKEKGVKVDLIIASPSRRTRETIIPIALAIGYDTAKIRWNNKIYRCSHSNYIEQVLKIPDKYQNVMMVGHNGATTTVSNVLQRDSSIANVPTTGVVAINFGETSWKDIRVKKGKLVFFDRPKNHK